MFAFITFGSEEAAFDFFFFSSRRRHTRCSRDWSSDVCSSDLGSTIVIGHERILHQRGPGPVSGGRWVPTRSPGTDVDCSRTRPPAIGEMHMSYAGTGNEKAVAAGDLNRTHVGLTVSFQADDFTVVFGRIGAIARKEGGVTLVLAGVVGTGGVP